MILVAAIVLALSGQTGEALKRAVDEVDAIARTRDPCTIGQRAEDVLRKRERAILERLAGWDRVARTSTTTIEGEAQQLRIAALMIRTLDLAAGRANAAERCEHDAHHASAMQLESRARELEVDFVTRVERWASRARPESVSALCGDIARGIRARVSACLR
jgi:hypothetical protein